MCSRRASRSGRSWWRLRRPGTWSASHLSSVKRARPVGSSRPRAASVLSLAVLGHEEHCPARAFDAIDTGSFQSHGEGACACDCLGGDAPVSRARAASCSSTKCRHADARSAVFAYSVPPTRPPHDARPEHPQPVPLTIGALRLLRWQVSLSRQRHRSAERDSGRSAAAR